MKIFECSNCGHAVYFGNTQCTACQCALAFDPISLSMLSGAGQLCANGLRHQACNWLTSPGSTTGFCLSCELNRTIPNLADTRNLQLWQHAQREKNHLVYSLLNFGLPVVSQDVAPETGLAFDCLDARDNEEGDVMTGHARGVITLNIDEADDAIRERLRQQMNEPYRTLLGHFRHESAHYYWDRLVRDSAWLAEFRELFGDERQDYAASLEAHYARDAPADWSVSYISTYASSHPWEDWAETWAHYFHIVDALETATQLGMTLDPTTGRTAPPDPSACLDPYSGIPVDSLIDRWLPISLAMNMLNRSLGQRDAYPFLLTPAVQNKLGLVNRIIADQSGLAHSGGSDVPSGVH